MLRIIFITIINNLINNNLFCFQLNKRSIACLSFALLLIAPTITFSDSVLPATYANKTRGVHSGTMLGQGGIQLSRSASDPKWFGDDETFNDWQISLESSSRRITTLEVGDVNGDGWLDVLAVGGGRLFVHYGKETQKNQWDYSSSSSYPAPLLRSFYTPESFALGDMDNDGYLDLMQVFDTSGVTINRMWREAGGIDSNNRPLWWSTVAPDPNWPVPNSPTPGVPASTNLRTAEYVDIDQDGDLDVIISIVSSGAAAPGYQQYENVGTAQAPVWEVVADNRWNLDQVTNRYTSGTPQLSFGDLDGDSDVDLMAYGCVAVNNCSLNFFRNDDGSGTSWTPMASWAVTSTVDFSSGFRLGDVDSDGDADIMYIGTGFPNGIRNDAVVSFSASGTFTSKVMDISSDNVGYTAINYADYIPLGTTLSIKVRAGNTPEPDPSWTDWSASALSDGADITDQVQTYNYLQYKVDLSSSNTALSPSIRDISFSFSVDPPTSSAPETSGFFFQTAWSRADTVCAPSETGPVSECKATAENNQSGWVGFTSENAAIDANVTDSIKLVGVISSTVETAQEQILGTFNSTMSTKTGVRLYRAPTDPVWWGDDETFWDWSVASSFNRERVIAVGDVNNDGISDALLDVISYSDETLYLSNGPSGTLTAIRANYFGSNVPAGIALGDLNDDGFLDVIMVKSDGSILTYVMYDLLDSGRPYWELATWDNPTGGSPGLDTDRKRPSLVDLDQDGDLDLIISLVGSAGTAPGYQQFENVGTPKAPVWQAFDVSVDRWNLNQTVNNYTSGQPQLSFGDVDGDGDPDMLASNACLDAGCEIYVFRNNGGGTSWTLMNGSVPSAPQNWGLADRPSSIYYQLSETPYFRLGDVDGDGDSDILYLGHVTRRSMQAVRNDAAVSFSSSGSFLSQVIDIGNHGGFTTLDYTANVPTGTTLSIRVRSGNTADLSAVAWSAAVASGGDISQQGENRFIQYEVQMTTTDNTISPTLINVSFNHYVFPATPGSIYDQDRATLYSSFFNTMGQLSTIDSISWNELLTAPDQDIRIQVQTLGGAGPQGTDFVPGTATFDYSGWVGPDGTSNTYWNSANDFGGACSKSGTEVTCALMPSVIRDGNLDQWFQYKVELVSLGGGTSPILSDITINFTTRDFLNEAPQVKAIAPATWSMTTDENRAFRFFVNVSDANENKVSLRLTGGADLAAFTFADGTRETAFERPWLGPGQFEIILTERPDFEFPTDAGADGTYDLEVTATEFGAGGLSSTQTLSLQVQNVNEGPIITSPVPPVDSLDGLVYLFVDENTVSVTTVTSNDLDSSTNGTYAIVGGADRAKFVIDENTGELFFVTAPDFEAPTDFGQNNQYDVQIAAIDSTAPFRVSLLNIVVTVNDISDSSPPGTDTVSSGVDTEAGMRFVVTSNLDAVDMTLGDGICSTALSGNPCTLRAAIQEANTLKNSFADGVELPDSITFANNTLPTIYSLTIEGQSEDFSETGDLDITDSLRITGNSSDMGLVVIDAKGIDRAIDIHSNNTTANTVELNYLSITGGTVPQAYSGAGICIDCGKNDADPYQPVLTTSDTFIDQIGDTTSDFQPVVNLSELATGTSALPVRSVVTLRFVDIYDNRDADAGSGIMNEGILTIEDSFIQNNGNQYYFGADSFMFVDGVRPGGIGGGIANWGGKVTIRRSILSGNAAQTGGAIYSQPILTQFRNEQIFIENSQITGNRAFMGGGIFNVTGDWDFPSRTFIDYGVVVKNSTLDSNLAYFLGGAIYTVGLSALQLDNVTVSNNQADSSTGGFGSLANKGGAIYHAGKILDIDLSGFTGNRTPAIHSQKGGSPTEYSNELIGGDDVFLDVSQANVDPESSLPWRFSLLNTAIGTVDPTDQTDACFGTTGFVGFIEDIGGNTDDSNTCIPPPAPPAPKPGVRSVMNKPGAQAPAAVTVLGPLTNNGGLPGNELPDGTFPPTHELLAGSAIGSGIDCAGLDDQRGYGREREACDSGPFQTNGNTKGITSGEELKPIARDDNFLIPENGELTLRLSQLLENDSDPLHRGRIKFDKDSVQLIDENGSVVRVGKGQKDDTSSIDYLYFTPIPDFLGKTRFSYRVSVLDSDTGKTRYS
ncbi:MAG TPA: hypothetical protein ENK06_00365, partial [Gammaproteobacteria bacterium]|nr:hypothetical protein [Gammaproteobacteria bacterium]